MNINDQDLQVIALRLGLLEMEKAVLSRENRELVAALAVAEARLEEVGNPSGLGIEEIDPVPRKEFS